MKKGLIIGLAVVLVLGLATMGMAVDIDGEGSGWFRATTHMTGSSTLHDVATISAYHWDTEQTFTDMGFVRTVDMDYGTCRSGPGAAPIGTTNLVEYYTAYSGSETIVTVSYLESTKTYDVYGEYPQSTASKLAQDYTTGSSVTSDVKAYSNTYGGVFTSSIRDAITLDDSTFFYQYSHTRVVAHNSQNKDRVRVSCSDPRMDLISSGLGAEEINIYIGSNFQTDIDGLILPSAERGMFSGEDPGIFGFNRPDLANEVKDGTRVGAVYEFSGSFFDLDFTDLPATIVYFNEWENCHAAPIGFTIEKYNTP